MVHACIALQFYYWHHQEIETKIKFYPSIEFEFEIATLEDLECLQIEL